MLSNGSEQWCTNLAKNSISKWKEGQKMWSEADRT